MVRELVVFAAIAALGGCESQLKAHTGANLKEGNTKQNLADALQIAIPLNGFPRTLNALAVVNSFK
nr:carboxymuconolactone decarboxylase family protein [Parasutterella muris]